MNVPPGISAELSNINHKTKKKMKKTLSIAFAAFALFAFTSCQKESLQDNESTNGVRIITAEFENNATKTDLNSDGVTPEWKLGDKIMLLNNSDQQEIEIISGSGTPFDGKAYINGTGLTISTHLDNTLYAVYPASATTMTSCSGSIDFTIPAVQDGTFASANICVAKSMEDDETNKDNLVFSNATSVLEFSQTAASTGVLRVAVTATNAIAGKLTASFGTDNKATISTDGLTGKIIYTTAAATAQNKYYVAVAPVETGDITFNYYKAEEEKSESKTTKTLALNKIYALTIPTEDYTNSYVEIKMTVGGTQKTYKWAKCNIGATKETDYGDYYAWGTTVKAYSAVDYSKTTGAFTFVSSNPYGDIYKNSWDASKGFNWVNTPFTNGEYSSPSNKKVFTKYVPESKKTDYGYDGNFFDNKEVLDPDDDVARKVLGGDWRMPTQAEFDALCRLTKEWKTNYNSSGVDGYLFTDDNSNSIFLPAAGNGKGTDLKDVDFGYYWSSSLYTSGPNSAYQLRFYNGGAGTITESRFGGRSVRALSE